MPEVVKWEHIIVNMPPDPSMQLEPMDSYGKDGWQLVTVLIRPDTVCPIAYFRRPLSSSQPPVGKSYSPPVRAIRVYYFLHYDAVERISSAIPLSFDSDVGVSGSGRTPEEAVEQLKEAVRRLMMHHVATGDLPFNAYKPRPGDSSVVVSFPENYPS